MKSYRITLIAAALAAVVSCAEKAQVKGVVEGASSKKIVVRQLDVNVYRTLDTIKTGKDGSFSYAVTVAKGQPEFIYLFYGDTRVAALLLETGETAVVKADTLGNYAVSGSEGSAKLAEVDKAYVRFLKELGESAGQPGAATRLYIKHYRDDVKYVMSNAKSLSVIPVLYETVGQLPVFSQVSDAVIFRSITDSLKSVYPDSKYVKALEKETERRVQNMSLNTRLASADAIGYLDVNLPDMNGSKRALSSLDSKVILLHFWDCADPMQSMLNIEGLLPVYKDFHDKGLEIYSVCLNRDKAAWGSVVLSQKLPWINVNDGNGALCPAALNYNVTSLPMTLMINEGELVTDLNIKGEAALRKELAKRLK